MKIDLQIHTTFSDGKNTPEEIIEMAVENNVKVISVTDHDSIKGVSGIISLGKTNNIIVIPGVEIATGYKDKALHILGYNIDPQNKELQELFDRSKKEKVEHYIKELDVVNSNLRQDGKQELSKEIYSDGKHRYSYPGLMAFLVEQKAVSDINGTEQFMKGVKHVAPSVTPKQAFELIHNAGGLAYFSHPLSVGGISLKTFLNTQEEWESAIAEFKADGLDGLEIYQAAHSKEDRDFLLNIASKYDLKISAGSDWHGPASMLSASLLKTTPNYPDIIGDLEIPEDKVVLILQGLGITA
ncbi:MAG: PHP domain-containing protein [Candidatus Doudnabacteria bacterium]